MKVRFVRLLATALAATLCAIPSGAHAYRTLADDRSLMSAGPITWNPPFIEFELAPVGLSPSRLGLLAGALEQAAAAVAAPACSGFRIDIVRSGPGHAEPGDGRNTTEWVASGWSRRGLPPDAAATTDVIMRRDASGVHIVEADVYLNGAIRWRGLDGSTEGPSLVPAILHEFLHVAGLLHVCELDGSGGAPRCASNDELYRTSAVYPIHQDGAETLSPDDLVGLCSLYPRELCAHVDCESGLVCIQGACRRPEDVLACGPALDCAACASDADCAPQLVCLDGACRDPIPLGQPCTADGECASGLCADRRCTVECAAAGDCPHGFECLARGWCRAQRLSREPCVTGDDCASGLCLSWDAGAACTSACVDDAACLASEVCRSVDGASVCAPRPAPSGCAAASGNADGGWVLALLSVLWLAGRSRRSRGRSLRVSEAGER